MVQSQGVRVLRTDHGILMALVSMSKDRSYRTAHRGPDPFIPTSWEPGTDLANGCIGTGQGTLRAPGKGDNAQASSTKLEPAHAVSPRLVELTTNAI